MYCCQAADALFALDEVSGDGLGSGGEMSGARLGSVRRFCGTRRAVGCGAVGRSVLAVCAGRMTGVAAAILVVTVVAIVPGAWALVSIVFSVASCAGRT